MTNQQFDFFLACQTVGGVCGCNGRYQELLYKKIEKVWRNLTIQQLMDAIEEASREFNAQEERHLQIMKEASRG